MTFSKRNMFLNIFLAALSASALLLSCDLGTNAESFTVTYSAGEGGGTAPAAQSGVASETSITLPGQGSMTAPEKKTFAGWSANGQTYAAGASYAVTADVSFAARWVDSTYTVTYELGGGTGTAPAAQSGVVSGTSITLPEQGSMTAPGEQIFAGWSASGQTYAAGAGYAVTADVSFAARWVSPDAPTYTVTYDLGGGTGTAPDAQSGIASGTSITLPAQGSMTAPGNKIFGGWSANGQTYAADASYPVTADVTFTAQWAVEYRFEAETIFVGYMVSMDEDAAFPIYIIIKENKGFEVRSYYGLAYEVLRSRGNYVIAGNGITLTQSELITFSDNTPIPFPVYTFRVDADEDGVIRTFSGEDFRWPLPTMGSVGGNPTDAANNPIERFTFNVFPDK
jgi:hypothetical protein